MFRLQLVLRTAATIFACIVLVLLFLTLPQRDEAYSIGDGSTGFGDLSRRFSDLATKKGALYAFDVLRRSQLPPQTDLHLLGHVVGDELYKQKGIEGIADCTQEFRNACSHSIVIGALTEYRDTSSTIQLIQKACEKAPGGPGAYTMCFHGLGHGVFAYFGYNLPSTVAFCKRAGQEAYAGNDSDQCISGAIMELVGGGGHDREKWIEARKKYFTDDPLSPCMSAMIPSSAKTLCLSYITPRLFEGAGADLGNPDPSTYPAAFAYCDEIPKQEDRLRDSCYGGFGKEFVPLAANRDIRRIDELPNATYAQAIEWCKLAPHTEARSSCIKQALSSVFWGGENDPEASFRFCELAGEFMISCNQELAENIRRYTDGERRMALCARLPGDSGAACTSNAVTEVSEL